MWPMGEMWGLHDFSLEGAQGGSSFIERVKKSYGGANSAEEWVKLAQFVNYEGYRGDVRGAEQEPDGPADLDEPPGVAFLRVADLRLLLRSDGGATSPLRRHRSRCISNGTRPTTRWR